MVHAFLITLAVMAAVYLFPVIVAILISPVFWVCLLIAAALLVIACICPAALPVIVVLWLIGTFFGRRKKMLKRYSN
jgi:hypothetical protein